MNSWINDLNWLTRMDSKKLTIVYFIFLIILWAIIKLYIRSNERSEKEIKEATPYLKIIQYVLVISIIVYAYTRYKSKI